MIKDLGEDILNLVPVPTNNDPWEDEEGPLFPELDNKLAAAKAAGATLSIPRCYSWLEIGMY